MLEASDLSMAFMKQANFRSQKTFYTWLRLQEFGPNAQKKLEMISEYFKEMKKRANKIKEEKKVTEIEDESNLKNLMNFNMNTSTSSENDLQ